MRLLQTSKIELHEFFDDQIPDYAILSHRWEDGEVTFQIFQSGEGKELPGYQKILNLCAKAALDGWEYAWIDSCCIDKSSSSELSEAINSMYKWYANAKICYAYLCDVDVRQNIEKALRLSQWFTRGWTLQELLAPKRLEFYDQNWIEFGTKQSLSWLLAEITGIRSQILHNNWRKWKFTCVAEKMSWAANRKTTRAEDLAYCLIGLFSVNMPLLYGEGGRNAFVRLQTEIMSKIDDESIFAWNYAEHDRDRLPLLAEHPSWFANSGKFERYFLMPFFQRSTGHQMTNRGVRIEVSHLPNQNPNETLDLENRNNFLLPLNCYEPEAPHDRDYYNIIALQMITVYGRKLATVDRWCRRRSLTLIRLPSSLHNIPTRDQKIIYVPQIEKFVSPHTRPSRTLIRTLNLARFGFTLIDDNDWSYQLAGRGLHYIGQNLHGDLILQNPDGTNITPRTECGLLFSNGSIKFALVIHICSYHEALTVVFDLQSGVPSPGQEFCNIGMWKKRDIPFWTSQTEFIECSHQERSSFRLKEDLYVSASAKLSRDSGDLINIFDVEIGSRARWVNDILYYVPHGSLILIPSSLTPFLYTSEGLSMTAAEESFPYTMKRAFARDLKTNKGLKE